MSGSRSFLSKLREGDEIARIITFIFASTVVLVTLLLVFELWHGSSLARHKFGFSFFVTSVWDPIEGQFGALPFIYGTLVTAFLALAISVPLGIGAAIFLAELAPQKIPIRCNFLSTCWPRYPASSTACWVFSRSCRSCGSSFSPSSRPRWVFCRSSAVRRMALDFSTAGIVLAIMVIPYIVSVSREVLLSVPRDQREAALALGSTRWESTWKVVVPFARTGIMGSIFLALARALGETMAVTMVIGNTPTISASLFSPGYSIAAVIANEFSEATGDLYLQSLIELGLVLFILTFVLNGLARLLIVLTAQRGSEMGRT